MANKRLATSELNSDNWDDEDEKEDRGTFLKATPETLQKRVIKTARRRNADSEKGSTANIFSGFSAFAEKTPSTAPTASSFSFLANLTNGKVEPVKTNGSETFFNKIESPIKESFQEEKKDKEVNSPDKPDEYYAKLKGLNQSVTQWIKSNVDENPFCILTPIFKDYEKYLKDIEAISVPMKSSTPSKTTTIPIFKTYEKNLKESESIQFPAKSTATPKTTSLLSSSTNSSTILQSSTSFPIPTFSTVPRTESKDGEKNTLFNFPPDSSNAIFGFLAKSTNDKPSFSFGSNNAAISSPSSLSFGIAKPLPIPTVENIESTKVDEEENEDDTPPKVTFTPVIEENSVYNKRCKVFIKKDGDYSDRGTGTLYIKSVENSNKHQLIVRAETSLGNLLLNLILSDSIPIQKMGKNNVMMVCMPTPDFKSAPVPTLLRVKTSEDADELLEALNKFKN